MESTFSMIDTISKESVANSRAQALRACQFLGHFTKAPHQDLFFSCEVVGPLEFSDVSIDGSLFAVSGYSAAV